MAVTFVYVSNAADGDISTYRMESDGRLQPGARVKAASMVGPMAVSRDGRVLYAAARSKPYTLFAYAIDPASGALQLAGTAPLVDSLPFIVLDRTGRFLLGASYGGHLVSVNAVGGDGKVAPEPVQVIRTGRNPHSIRTDRTNRFVYVPHLGTDQIFQFRFDERTGMLASSTPPVVQLPPGTGPRHFVLSPDNRFVYLLSEMVGTVTTLSLDPNTGLLAERGRVSGLPADTPLRPGLPRGPVGPGGPPPRNTDQDIWAADIHMTPDGKFLYASERTSSTLAAFRVHPDTGEPAYLGSTPTERQPRGFAIDSAGRFLVAAGERSDTLSSYAIDPASGGLHLLGKYPVGEGANWVEIVRGE
jgi:6-phosphogluconolactonase